MRRLLLLCLLLLAGLLAAPHAAAAGISILRNEALSDFPVALRFELEASSATPITDVLLLYTEGSGETLVEVRPEFDPGTTIEVSYERDTQIYFLPTGITIRYKWVLSDEAGNTVETPLQEVRYEDQRFDWQELTERNVTVRWYEGGDVFGRKLMSAVVRTLDRFKEQFGRELTQPVRITIYANVDDMRAALGPNPREWIGGEARPDLGLIIGAIDPDDDAEIGRLIPHELSHIVLHQAAETPYGGSTPYWFDEGLAVLNEEVSEPYLDQLVEEAARTGQLIPLEALASPFPADYEKALLSYGQSASIVRFIQETYNRDQFAALLEQFSTGATPNEATLAALGVTVEQLDQQWRQTLPPVTDPAPTATPALHAPADRFDVTTSGVRPPAQPGGENTPSPGNLPVIGGIPTAWFLAGLALGLGLLLTGVVLIVRAIRQ
ncbi:MAG: hypothetical protein KatS3mg057_0987 [Herpetosiphonaceae bacterium]|nr:MAG: hypothetical protein KatS3mg057_0987 [Herpetosiphonaceae bacterium]